MSALPPKGGQLGEGVKGQERGSGVKRGCLPPPTTTHTQTNTPR